MTKKVISELLGDGIGPELRESVHTVADALPIDFDFIPLDLSLKTRESSGRSYFDEIANSLHETRLGLKYPTVTATSSPNAIIRRLCNFSVILRPVASMPGVETNFKQPIDIQIVRIATGGTYDDPGRRIGDDGAISVRIVERTPCRQAARFAFRLALEQGLTVTSSSKHTIQRETDGFFQMIADEVQQEFPGIIHQVELFDALLAKIVLKPEDYSVVLVLNEYGDFLSDMASGLAGGIGLGASGNFSFDENDEVDIAMFDPSGGTAPDIAGQNKCNPTAILLAFAMLLDHIKEKPTGDLLRGAIGSAISDGACTGDIGGSMSTTQYTNEVISRLSG